MGCGDWGYALFYMISFQFVFALIFLNLFVAVILEGFDESSRLENANLSEYYLMVLKRQWLKFDEKAIGLIECKNLLAFLEIIHLPWEETDDEKREMKDGSKKDEKKNKLSTIMQNMHLPIIELGDECIEGTESKRPKVYFLF